MELLCDGRHEVCVDSEGQDSSLVPLHSQLPYNSLVLCELPLRLVCRQYTRSYLHHVVTRGISSASILVTYHNVAYMQVR